MAQSKELNIVNCPCGLPAKKVKATAGHYVCCSKEDPTRHIVEVGPYGNESLAVKKWNELFRPLQKSSRSSTDKSDSVLPIRATFLS